MFFLRTLAAFLCAHTAFALSPIGRDVSGKLVFEAPAGSSVRQSGRDFQVIGPNKDVIHVFKDVAPEAAASASRKRNDGLITSVSAASVNFPGDDQLINIFTSSFTVPPAPTTFEDQLIYLTYGVQAVDPNTGNPFGMQRVALQYGDNSIHGGDFWSLALQLEVVLDDGTKGVLQISPGDVDPTVVPGTKIVSSLTLDQDALADGAFVYNASFVSGAPAGFPSFEAGFTIRSASAVLQLEEAGVTQASDYPAGSFVFEDVNLDLTTGAASVAWQTTADPANGVTVKVVQDGAQNGKIEVDFPTTL